MLNSARDNPPQRMDGGTSSCREAIWFLIGRTSEQETVRQIPIYMSPFQVGRRTSASLCLPSNAVSSLHAELIETGVSLLLRDLGSTNGTFVNGTRVRELVELREDDLVQFASIPFRVARQSISKHQETVSVDACDRALLLVQFDKLMAQQALAPHYQPIVNLPDGSLIGYEVLARSSIVGLENPAAMFSAAAQLNLQTKLSEMIRSIGVQLTLSASDRPHLFLNTHPLELAGSELIASMRTLREMSPRQALTLEIHEAAITEAGAMRDLRCALCELNIGLAFDDFGAGQARFSELVEIQPEYLKFDMSLIRDIDTAPAEKVQMVASLVKMARDMEIIPLAEGIETAAERDCCARLGFELAQGYFFGKPAAFKSF